MNFIPLKLQSSQGKLRKARSEQEVGDLGTGTAGDQLSTKHGREKRTPVLECQFLL
jgi:hypothetical protein